MLTAQKEQERLASAIELLREENEELRQLVKRFSTDSGTIEATARADHALMQKDEIKFVVGSNQETGQHDEPTAISAPQ